MNPVLEAMENDDLDTFSRLVGTTTRCEMGGTRLAHGFIVQVPTVVFHFVKYLVENGADVNLYAGVYETGPIKRAASGGHLHVLDYLLKHGAKLDVSTPNRNPMFGAISNGHVSVASFLLEAGIDRDVVYRSVTGKLKNALSYARERDEREIAELLIKAGCRLPIEGVDKPVWEPAPEEIYQPTINDRARDQLVAHFGEGFGPVDELSQREIVPGHATVHVEIHTIRPNDKNDCLTLFTTGMSDEAMRVPDGQEEYAFAELVMHLPPTWPHPRDKNASKDTFWPFEWLRKVAYYPHLHKTWLGGSMTIISSDQPPVPLGPNTKQTCLLLLANRHSSPIPTTHCGVPGDRTAAKPPRFPGFRAPRLPVGATPAGEHNGNQHITPSLIVSYVKRWWGWARSVSKPR